MTVTLMAARVTPGDRVYLSPEAPPVEVVDYRTAPGALFWTLADESEVRVVPTRAFRVEIG